MINKKHIGMCSKPYSVDVEKGQLAFFARTIREQNKMYFDEEAAQAQGHPTIPAPPTFIFSLSLANPEQGKEFIELDIDPKKVLHAEQHFEYLHPVYAGDTIKFQTQLVDIYDKKGGALEFVVNQTMATNQHNVDVVKMTCTYVVKH